MDERDADKCYRQYAVFATSLGSPEDAWPADREAFARYWKQMVDTVTVGDDARQICQALMHPVKPPLALRIATPLNRFVAIGLLPERLREQFGYGWSPRQARRLDRLIRTTAFVYPHLPVAVRQLQVTYYLRDLRKRMHSTSKGTST
jgi:uncharacterized protein (DUF2236 family)